MFFMLLVGHAVMDYALQTGPMPIEKCRTSTSEIQKAVPWYYWLTAHALGHGGAVYLVTGSVSLGILETAIHWLIDFGKCEGWFGIHVDQALHVACKVLWCMLIAYGVPAELDAYIPAIRGPG